MQVIGVEPELANDAAMSFREGHVVSLSAEETARTIADGLRVQQLGKFPFANIRAYTRDIVTVTEDEIKAAMRKIAAEARLIAEPSGAVALAGALKLGLDPKTSVAVLSGGNVELGFYAQFWRVDLGSLPPPCGEVEIASAISGGGPTRIRLRQSFGGRGDTPDPPKLQRRRACSLRCARRPPRKGEVRRSFQNFCPNLMPISRGRCGTT